MTRTEALALRGGDRVVLIFDHANPAYPAGTVLVVWCAMRRGEAGPLLTRPGAGVFRARHEDLERSP